MASLPESTHELLIRDQARLSALARVLLRDAHAADDVVQDAWLVATTKPHRLGNVPAWLRTVTRNRALSRLRSAARRRDREQKSARSDRLPSTVERVEEIELRRRLLDAVESLDERYRSTSVSRYLDELAPSAIAREHGIAVKTVNTRLARCTGPRRLAPSAGPTNRSLPAVKSLGPIHPGIERAPGRLGRIPARRREPPNA